MSDLLQHVWNNLIGRVSGPMKFRLVLQPLVAIFFAARAGIRDAREGRPAFLWTALTDKSQRRALLRSAWADIGRVFIVACIVDAIYQLIELHRLSTVGMLFVATILALLPYFILRGPVSRLVKLVHPSHTKDPHAKNQPPS